MILYNNKQKSPNLNQICSYIIGLLSPHQKSFLPAAQEKKYGEPQPENMQSEKPLSLHQISALRALPAEKGVERGHQEIKGLLSTLG